MPSQQCLDCLLTRVCSLDKLTHKTDPDLRECGGGAEGEANRRAKRPGEHYERSRKKRKEYWKKCNSWKGNDLKGINKGTLKRLSGSAGLLPAARGPGALIPGGVWRQEFCPPWHECLQEIWTETWPSAHSTWQGVVTVCVLSAWARPRELGKHCLWACLWGRFWNGGRVTLQTWGRVVRAAPAQHTGGGAQSLSTPTRLGPRSWASGPSRRDLTPATMYHLSFWINRVTVRHANKTVTILSVLKCVSTSVISMSITWRKLILIPFS